FRPAIQRIALMAERLRALRRTLWPARSLLSREWPRSPGLAPAPEIGPRPAGDMEAAFPDGHGCRRRYEERRSTNSLQPRRFHRSLTRVWIFSGIVYKSRPRYVRE